MDSCYLLEPLTFIIWWKYLLAKGDNTLVFSILVERLQFFSIKNSQFLWLWSLFVCSSLLIVILLLFWIFIQLHTNALYMPRTSTNSKTIIRFYNKFDNLFYTSIYYFLSNFLLINEKELDRCVQSVHCVQKILEENRLCLHKS